MSAARKKHLAIVAHSIQTGGGVGQVALQQATTLASHFQVSVVCIHRSDTPEGISVHTIKPAKLNWLRRFGHVLRERINARRLQKKLREIDRRESLDFILYHSHATASLCHASLRPEIKSGLVVHGDIFSRPVDTYGPELTRFYKIHSRPAYEITDLIVSLSPSMRDRICTYGNYERKIAVVENGLAIPDWQSRQKPEHPSEFRVLFIGRLAVEKDPVSLVKAMRHCPDDVSLTIIGGGQLEQQIKSLVRDLDLEDRIAMVGYKSKSDLLPYFQRSNVLCIPSISDPLPTVVLEAMSLGLAVIGANVDGIPHMVDDGTTGLLVAPGDEQGLANAIMALADQPLLAYRMGQAGFEKFKSEFSLEVTGKKLIDAINQTLGHGGQQ